MMVTKAKAPVGAKRVAPRKPVAEATAGAEASKPANLLRAGLQALDKARQDVAERQSRVFEAILGLDTSSSAQAAPRENTAAKLAADAFGLRKFEAVFDQRVAAALERLGVPSVDALRAMSDELAALRSEVAALRAQTKTASKAPVKKAPRRR